MAGVLRSYREGLSDRAMHSLHHQGRGDQSVEYTRRGCHMIEQRVTRALQWMYANLPPIIFIPILMLALPVALAVLLCVPARYTGIFDDD